MSFRNSCGYSWKQRDVRMINAAIIGLGWWGKTLVEAVSGVSDDIRFVAGTTRTLSDDAKQFAHLHNLNLYDTYDDIIGDPDIDAVVLVTPNSLHAEQTIAAAENSKHIFCEKPFALTGADAQRAMDAVMVSYVKENGVEYGYYDAEDAPGKVGADVSYDDFEEEYLRKCQSTEFCIAQYPLVSKGDFVNKKHEVHIEEVPLGS